MKDEGFAWIGIVLLLILFYGEPSLLDAIIARVQP